MRKQLITLGACIGAVVFAFVAGTAIASHFNSNGNNHSGNGSHGRFGTGPFFGQGSQRRFGPGGSLFGGLRSGTAVIGRVTKVSGDTITVSSFGSGTETVVVNGSTKYTKRSFGSSGPTSTSASLSSIKSGIMILVTGSKSEGRFLAKSISIVAFHRPAGGFHGFGQGGTGFGPRGGPYGYSPPSGSQPPSTGSGNGTNS